MWLYLLENPFGEGLNPKKIVQNPPFSSPFLALVTHMVATFHMLH